MESKRFYEVLMQCHRIKHNNNNSTHFQKAPQSLKNRTSKWPLKPIRKKNSPKNPLLSYNVFSSIKKTSHHLQIILYHNGEPLHIKTTSNKSSKTHNWNQSPSQVNSMKSNSLISQNLQPQTAAEAHQPVLVLKQQIKDNSPRHNLHTITVTLNDSRV